MEAEAKEKPRFTEKETIAFCVIAGVTVIAVVEIVVLKKPVLLDVGKVLQGVLTPRVLRNPI